MGQKFGSGSGYLMRWQSDVNWGLQSSETLTGDGKFISKKAYSHCWQVGSSPYGPLHSVA